MIGQFYLNHITNPDHSWPGSNGNFQKLQDGSLTIWYSYHTPDTCWEGSYPSVKCILQLLSIGQAKSIILKLFMPKVTGEKNNFSLQTLFYDMGNKIFKFTHFPEHSMLSSWCRIFHNLLNIFAYFCITLW